MQRLFEIAGAIGLAGFALAPTALAQCETQELTTTLFNARFVGRSAAIAGDQAVVGAPGSGHPGTGAVFVYEHDGDDWVEVTSVLPTETGFSGFGEAVAMDTDVALAGAYFWEADQAGAAWIIERGAGSWTDLQKLSASDASAGDGFGWRVAISGSCAMVSNRRNKVYVLERVAGVWTETQILEVGDGVDRNFGDALSLEASLALIGAPRDDDQGSSAGAVYVYTRVAGTWTQVDKLYSSQTSRDEQFGQYLSLDGTRMAVRAGLDRTHVLERIGSTWIETDRLRPNDFDDSFDRRIGSVHLSGDLAVVGHPGEFWYIAGGRGSAYVFREVGGEWRRIAKLRASRVEHWFFGTGLALDGGRVLMGNGGDLYFSGGFTFAFEVADNAVTYCFCRRGAPCGNTGNESGCKSGAGEGYAPYGGAFLGASGTSSVSADDLELHAVSLPANALGLFTMGSTRVAGAGLVPASNGKLCVGGTRFRLGIQNTGPERELVVGPGLVAWTQANLPSSGHIVAGQTWNFQAWYRDADDGGGPCNTGSNTSNAIAITFTP